MRTTVRARALMAVALLGALGAGERFVRSTSAVASGAAAVPFYDTRDFTPRWTPVEHRVAPFTLVDQQRRVTTERDLDGKIHVASFLFAECPSVCPTLVTKLKPVQDAIRGDDGVVMVSYSVTPVQDTPDVLAKFGKARGIDPAKWKLLTGDIGEISRVIRESYFADDTRMIDGAPESRILHTEKVLLVDRERRLRGIYKGTDAFEMERLVEDIRALEREPSRGPAL